MDPCRITVDTFDRYAERYADKFLSLDLYDAYYRRFCQCITRQGATVLDLACGPGNVSAFLARERPDLQVLGIDLAPNMVRLARSKVPTARFLVHDCRHLADLGRAFDGLAYAFGLSYLDQPEAERFFASLDQALAPGGVLYLSTVSGPHALSGLHTSPQGDQLYTHYRSPQQIEQWVRAAGLDLVLFEEIASPPNAARRTTDVVLVAVRAGRGTDSPLNPQP